MKSSATSPVLVLGARGTTGRRMVERLRAVGVSVRAASRSGDTFFDWSDPASWRPAVAGARAVYLVEQGSPGVLTTAAFARLAAAEGVGTIVLLSSREADLPGYEDHLAAEMAIRSAGTGWTILRPSWFAQNFMTHFDLEVRSGLLQLPAGEGREPFIDAEDIAAVAVAALTQAEHRGCTYELSGPRALSYREAVDRISELTGLSVRYKSVTEAAYIDLLRTHGLPSEAARRFATVHRPVAEGSNEYVSDGVEQVLGRPPRDFDDVVRAAVAAGVWPAP